MLEGIQNSGYLFVQTVGIQGIQNIGYQLILTIDSQAQGYKRTVKKLPDKYN